MDTVMVSGMFTLLWLTYTKLVTLLPLNRFI